MRVKVFNTIDETLALLEERAQQYEFVRKSIKYKLMDVLFRENRTINDISSRVKSRESLREKIIRNRMYIKYDDAQSILDALSDGIGLKIECRFIDEEHKVFEALRRICLTRQEDGYSRLDNDCDIYLNVMDEQPQQQKNGFSIYRLDGYYLDGEIKIRFELQIKSLVNSFWGDIEHKLVYKNTNYYVYDAFMRKLLASINSNLSIIDQQLHIVYDEMENGDRHQTGLVNAESFELMLSKAINDLFTEKLKESIGFTINIKDTSNILGHYIFVKNIQESIERDVSGSIFRVFKQLNGTHIDFSEEIVMESQFVSNNIFSQKMGDYLISHLNEDYDWYVFFKMLFALEEGNNIEDFSLFMIVYLDILVDHYWFKTSFVRLTHEESNAVHDCCLALLANVLIKLDSIKIIHNENLTPIRHAFTHFVEDIEKRVLSLKDFKMYEEAYEKQLEEAIRKIF